MGLVLFKHDQYSKLRLSLDFQESNAAFGTSLTTPNYFQTCFQIMVAINFLQLQIMLATMLHRGESKFFTIANNVGYHAT